MLTFAPQEGICRPEEQRNRRRRYVDDVSLVERLHLFYIWQLLVNCKTYKKMKQLFTYLLAVLALLTVSQKMVAEDVYLQTSQTLNGVAGKYGIPSNHKMELESGNTYKLKITSCSGSSFNFRVGVGSNWDQNQFYPASYANNTPLGITEEGGTTSALSAWQNKADDLTGEQQISTWLVTYNSADYEYITVHITIVGDRKVWIDGKKKGSSGESYKSFYLIGNGEGIPWNENDESRQFTTTDGKTYTYTFPSDVTGNFYFRVKGKNENGTYFDNHLKPASITSGDGNTPIITDFTEANYGNYASWKISLGSDKKYTVTFKYYGTTRNPEIKYDEVSTVVTDYTITVTGGGAMSDANQTGMFTCDLSEATEDGVISAFTIDGEAWGLSVAETAGSSSASTYTFVKGGTANLTLPKGYKYTLKMTAGGLLSVTPSSSSTSRVLTEGYYLVGNFFNTDGTTINYDNAVFKFRQQGNDENGHTTYMVEIPASLTARAQIEEVNFAGKPIKAWGPGSVTPLKFGTPETNTSLSGTLVSTASEVDGTNYWDMTTRNANNSSTSTFDDGLYEISFDVDEDGILGSWTVEHKALRRVAYYLSTEKDAVALPIYDTRTNVSSDFSNRFWGTLNMKAGASYYVASNYINNKEYVDYLPSQYKAKSLEGITCPTANKLFLQGNGGLDYKTGTGYQKHNEVSPNSDPIKTGEFEGTRRAEYDPTKGYNNEIEDPAFKDVYIGIRGQVILQEGEEVIKSVSMVGPAIPNTMESDGTTWDYASTAADMTYDDNENCYKLTLVTSAADDGTKVFRFVGNHKKEYMWYENGTDADVKARFPYNSSNPGHTAAPSDPNQVSYTKGGSMVDVADSGSDVDIIWNRPAGRWTVRFYFYTYNVGGNSKTDYYYTITENTNLEMRDYGDVHYKGNRRTIEGIGDYKYFVTWSDNKVWNKPENVDAFVVSDVTPATESEGAKVTLTQLDKDYLPANTGLILAAKDKSSEGKITAYNAVGNNSTFNLLEEPMTEYTGTTEEIASKLSTQISPATVPTEDNGGWNYLFGFYKKMNVEPAETDASKFLLGFWLSKGQNLSYPHCAYLHLTKEEASDKYYVGNKYVMGGSTTTSGAKLMPAVLLDFKSGVVTGITELNAKESAKEDGKYYTLSGVAVSKPTASGIYIHNGKKYIVK